ncbi:hypothetical protein MRB53_038533 [Persea americana]|nr:hypothetical protein MRB53_038533 [Persea americana]
MTNDMTAITPSNRIRELSAISQEAAAIYRSAGIAIQTLTGVSSKPEDERNNNLASGKEEFDKNVQELYLHVQAVSAKLKRQVYALEEAGLIEGEKDDDAGKDGLKSEPLSSVSKDDQSNSKEAELLVELQKLLEQAVQKDTKEPT